MVAADRRRPGAFCKPDLLKLAELLKLRQACFGRPEKKMVANFKPETRKHRAIHLSADSSMRDSSPKPSLDHIVCGFDPRKQLNSKRGKFPNVHGFR